MIKAEERACQYTGYCKNQSYKDYLNGYNQAEKDNELSWEDMMLIHRCIKDATNYHLYKMLEGEEGQKTVYQEVLERFRERKDEYGRNLEKNRRL